MPSRTANRPAGPRNEPVIGVEKDPSSRPKFHRRSRENTQSSKETSQQASSDKYQTTPPGSTHLSRPTHTTPSPLVSLAPNNHLRTRFSTADVAMYIPAPLPQRLNTTRTTITARATTLAPAPPRRRGKEPARKPREGGAEGLEATSQLPLSLWRRAVRAFRSGRAWRRESFRVRTAWGVGGRWCRLPGAQKHGTHG